MGLDHSKLQKRRTRGGGGPGWKPKDGENRVRVLPPRSSFLDNWDEMDDVAIAFKMHFFKIDGRQTEVSRCLEEVGEKCPACAVWRAYRKSEDPGLAAMAKDISPSDQYLMNILDLNNLQGGIQRWASNWTCWDKILEIAANPQWGNVLDPANGVNFTVNRTPGNKTKHGYPAYSVMPEPQRTTVMTVLEQIPDWKNSLDELEGQIQDTKESSEIVGLLEEMGFPTIPGFGGGGGGGGGGGAPAPTPPPSPTPAPTPQAAPGPGTPPPQNQNPQPAAPAAPAAPAPSATPQPVEQAAPAAPAPTATPQPVEQAAPAQVQNAAAAAPAPATGTPKAAGEPHYDPGADYTPKVPEGERPPGAPRCFGDYSPQVHACHSCPVAQTCQMKLLGVEET